MAAKATKCCQTLVEMVPLTRLSSLPFACADEVAVFLRHAAATLQKP